MQNVSELPRLEQWRVTEADMLIGKVYGHPNFDDGEIVVTSRVASLDLVNRLAVTRNTNYILGKPYED